MNARLPSLTRRVSPRTELSNANLTKAEFGDGSCR